MRARFGRIARKLVIEASPKPSSAQCGMVECSLPAVVDPQGWEGLSAELALDVGRLWRRNLGRDDRVIADVSREARHPFLDESLIATLLGLPLPLVADLRLPPGAGDKALLRGALRR